LSDRPGEDRDIPMHARTGTLGTLNRQIGLRVGSLWDILSLETVHNLQPASKFRLQVIKSWLRFNSN